MGQENLPAPPNQTFDRIDPMKTLLKACKHLSATDVATAATLLVILAMGVSTLLPEPFTTQLARTA